MTYIINLQPHDAGHRREAEELAAELDEDAHLRDRERLELAGVQPAPPERPPAGA